MCIVHERRAGSGTARSLRWPCLLCSERTPVLPRRNRTWFSGTFVGTARGRVRRSGVPAWLGADARASTAEQGLVLRYICWNGVPGQSGVPLIGKKSAVFRVNLELDTKMLRTSILLILSRDGHKEFFSPLLVRSWSRDPIAIFCLFIVTF